MKKFNLENTLKLLKENPLKTLEDLINVPHSKKENALTCFIDNNVIETTKEHPDIVMLGFDKVHGQYYYDTLSQYGNVIGNTEENSNNTETIKIFDLKNMHFKKKTIFVNCYSYSFNKFLYFSKLCEQKNYLHLSFHEFIRIINHNMQVASQENYFQECFYSLLENFNNHLNFFNLFRDEKSKFTYACILANRITGDERFIFPAASPIHDLYFDVSSKKKSLFLQTVVHMMEMILLNSLKITKERQNSHTYLSPFHQILKKYSLI